MLICGDTALKSGIRHTSDLRLTSSGSFPGDLLRRIVWRSARNKQGLFSEDCSAERKPNSTDFCVLVMPELASHSPVDNHPNMAVSTLSTGSHRTGLCSGTHIVQAFNDALQCCGDHLLLMHDLLKHVADFVEPRFLRGQAIQNLHVRI